MDDIEFLVEQTFNHFNEHYGQTPAAKENPFPGEKAESEYPETAGVIYHIQKSASVFVIRTMVSQNIKEDFLKIVERPEDYPSLRLLEDGPLDVLDRLKYFIALDAAQAEIIHDQIHNRRFPVNEEMMCNLSESGFSWWLTRRPNGFQLAFTMSVASDENTIKLGPLGDRELAVRNFQTLENLVASAGLHMNIQNETNRVQFTDSEQFILEELKDVFEFGVVSETMTDLFKLLSKHVKEESDLQTTWFYLQEIAAMRRFWIQIQFDLNS